MRPDLSTLALFVRICELKATPSAAGPSHVAFAGASRRIAVLEEQFGVQLLYRTASGVEVTPAGTAMLFHARQLMGQVDQLRAELSDYTKGGKGLVRLQANTSALAQFLSHDLAAFAAKHPAVKVELEEQLSGAIVRALQSRATDLGLVMEGPPTGDLECFEYRTDTLVAVLPRKHALRGKRVAFVKLLDYDFVGLEGDAVLSQALAARASEEGKPLRLRVQLKGFDVVARMIQAGLGIGILPEAAARSFAGPMKLRRVPLTHSCAAPRMLVRGRQ